MKHSQAVSRGVPAALVAWALLAGSGCSYIEVVDHYGLSTQQLQQYKALHIVTGEELAGSNYHSIGEIRGLSCAKILGAIPNEQDAVDQVRLRASQAGAHAISSPVCVHSTDIDWSNNCWSRVICSAQVFIDQTREPPQEPSPLAPASSDN